MKEVKTWEDLKERKEKIISFMEESLRYSLDALREIIKLTETADDLKKEFTEFEEGLGALGDELDQEGFRIDDLPGVKENLGSFQDEIDKRLDPYAKELDKLGEELMSKIMGKFQEGFGDLLDEFTDMDEGKEGEE